MPGNWVDFKEIKDKITIEQVLAHLGLLAKLKKTAKGYRGCCPIHSGKHPNQFHVDTTSRPQKWNCFGGCPMDQYEGHVIGFVAALENISLRDAALKIAQWFDLDTGHPSKKKTRELVVASEEAGPDRRRAEKEPEPATNAGLNEEPENQPLTFELKTLASDHAFFKQRAITQEAIGHLGIGFCSRGMFRGRIVFPLHRPTDGKLIGYIGRTVEEVTDDNPKWLLPSIIKPKVLFNYHNLAGRYQTAIITEGPLDAVAVFQAGFSNVVSLLGRDILEDQAFSYDQLRLLAGFQQAVLLLDGDPDGRESTQKALERLAGLIFVRAVNLPEDKDPADFAPKELKSFLSFLK